MPLHMLRKRHASFAQKDYNGILKTDSFAVYSISDSFSYTLSSVTFFQKANRTTDAVLLLVYCRVHKFKSLKKNIAREGQ